MGYFNNLTLGDTDDDGAADEGWHVADRRSPQLYTITAASAIVNGVGTGATLVIADADGCWLATWDHDGEPRKITVDGRHVLAPAGWSTGAERV